MKTMTADATGVTGSGLLDEAQKVFSRGLVSKLQSQAKAFIEAERDGVYFFDEEGNRYLDCYSGAGMYNLGRKNPEIAAELKCAARETDQGNFVMLSEEKAVLGRCLDEFLPGNLECMLLGVVRGEGMDAACKLARGYTGRESLVTVDGGWYGHSGFALTLSECAEKPLFGTLIPGVTVIPFGDITAARTAITRRTAAFILEPVQAENRCRTADRNYIREIRRLCSRKGVMLIFDETQTGFGRTGKKFAYEHFNMAPDILVFGEAITGGMFPMAGIAFTQKLKSFFDAHPLIHMSTFGGHDVGCRVACKALDLYERTMPWQNALLAGQMLRDRLNDTMKKFPRLVRSVNGMGLLLSMEFADRKTAVDFCSRAMKHGLYAAPGEVSKCSVVFRPSLTLSVKEIGEIGDAVLKTAGEL